MITKQIGHASHWRLQWEKKTHVIHASRLMLLGGGSRFLHECTIHHVICWIFTLATWGGPDFCTSAQFTMQSVDLSYFQRGGGGPDFCDNWTTGINVQQEHSNWTPYWARVLIMLCLLSMPVSSTPYNTSTSLRFSAPLPSLSSLTSSSKISLCLIAKLWRAQHVAMIFLALFGDRTSKKCKHLKWPFRRPIPLSTLLRQDACVLLNFSWDGVSAPSSRNGFNK